MKDKYFIDYSLNPYPCAIGILLKIRGSFSTTHVTAIAFYELTNAYFIGKEAIAGIIANRSYRELTNGWIVGFGNMDITFPYTIGDYRDGVSPVLVHQSVTNTQAEISGGIDTQLQAAMDWIAADIALP